MYSSEKSERLIRSLRLRTKYYQPGVMAEDDTDYLSQEAASHIEAQEAEVARYQKTLRDIKALLPNPTLPITHAIRDIASAALSQKDTP